MSNQDQDDSDVPAEETALEKQYREACEKHMPEIERLVAEARAKLAEACNLADEHGILFYSNGISGVGQKYSPSKFEDLYDGISNDFLEALNGTYKPEYGGSGWEFSQAGC